jgi:hypothetical protein
MTRFERERLAHNLAEVIFDTLHATTLTTNKQHRIVAQQVTRAVYLGWKAHDNYVAGRGGPINNAEDQP